jgi:hypothetical protein
VLAGGCGCTTPLALTLCSLTRALTTNLAGRHLLVLSPQPLAMPSNTATDELVRCRYETGL